MEYRAAFNNRDGLALAAAGVDLLKRREDHKIIIFWGSDSEPENERILYSTSFLCIRQ